MGSSAELGNPALLHGLTKKRCNAIVALLSGALPGVLLAFLFHPSWERWLVGLVIGLLWGNAFEYAYHRWLLHRPRSSLGRGHLEHHMNVGTPEEAEHVSLGRSPWHIALLFASNGIVVVAADLLLGLRITPGIFVGWTAYLIAAEEIHWRIHMNGWLPPGLRFARTYHMSHHDIPNTRYNVFLPIFDLILGNSGFSQAKSDRLITSSRS
jgi:fatty acid hydroxylase family protein